MDQFMVNPFLSPAVSWVAKEDDDKLTLIMNMPGLGKEDVKVTVQQNTLIIKGEAQKESSGGDDDSSSSSEGGTRRKYSSKIDLPPSLYKLDEIKAEMKNDVLKILVSRLKRKRPRMLFRLMLSEFIKVEKLFCPNGHPEVVFGRAPIRVPVQAK